MRDYFILSWFLVIVIFIIIFLSRCFYLLFCWSYSTTSSCFLTFNSSAKHSLLMCTKHNNSQIKANSEYIIDKRRDKLVFRKSGLSKRGEWMFIELCDCLFTGTTMSEAGWQRKREENIKGKRNNFSFLLKHNYYYWVRLATLFLFQHQTLSLYAFSQCNAYV